MKRLLCAGLLIPISVLIQTEARADTITPKWVGTGPFGNWSDAANWDIGIVPNNNSFTNYNVSIPGGTFGVNVQENVPSVTIGSLSFNNGNTTLVGTSLTINNNLTGNGSVFVNDSSFLTV